MEMFIVALYLWAGFTTAWLAASLPEEGNGPLRWQGMLLQMLLWPATIPYFYVLTGIAIRNRNRHDREYEAEQASWKKQA